MALFFFLMINKFAYYANSWEFAFFIKNTENFYDDDIFKLD